MWGNVEVGEVNPSASIAPTSGDGWWEKAEVGSGASQGGTMGAWFSGAWDQRSEGLKP